MKDLDGVICSRHLFRKFILRSLTIFFVVFLYMMIISSKKYREKIAQKHSLSKVFLHKNILYICAISNFVLKIFIQTFL